MPLPDDWEATFANSRLQSARMRCPHCDIATTASVEFTTAQQAGHKAVHYTTLRCNYAKCRGLVFVVTTVTAGSSRQDYTDSLTTYPNRSIAPPHESLPVPVAEDWIEAQKAFN